ncbi:hypothetical protein JOF41_001302 [Saccharothrix coeruleofusca]|uniref:hypothetical protein n=1 Tax=Saccharothrix coeruleofusca TaxID=33919 RepID=UPI001AE420A0|nr:hypothetical protein [Saccharothrix coeruleofusca]MBP2335124.1 hypothetical protein [Saccharothrix coeruleofusca]
MTGMYAPSPTPQVWLTTYDQGLVRADLVMRIGAAELLAHGRPKPFGVLVQLHGDVEVAQRGARQYVVGHTDTLQQAEVLMLELLALLDTALCARASGVIDLDAGVPRLTSLHPAAPAQGGFEEAV